MERKKRKWLSSVLMVAMVLPMAALPASASYTESLYVWENQAFDNGHDLQDWLYGSTATINVANLGTEVTDMPVTFELYDFDWNLLAGGTLYSDYWIRYYDYDEEKTFSGTFTTDTGGFRMTLNCEHYPGIYCEGSATIQID